MSGIDGIGGGSSSNSNYFGSGIVGETAVPTRTQIHRHTQSRPRGSPPHQPPRRKYCTTRAYDSCSVHGAIRRSVCVLVGHIIQLIGKLILMAICGQHRFDVFDGVRLSLSHGRKCTRKHRAYMHSINFFLPGQENRLHGNTYSNISKIEHFF